MGTYRFKSSQRFKKHMGMKETSGVNPGGGEWTTRSAVYEPVVADVELLVDTEGLMKLLGGKALHSKRSQSSALHGLLKCKVVKVRPGGHS